MLRTAAETDPASARRNVAALLASSLFDLNRSVDELTDVTVTALLDLNAEASPSRITSRLLRYVDVDDLPPYEKAAVRIVLAGLFGNWGDIHLQLGVADRRDDVDRGDVLLLLARLAAVTLQRWSAHYGQAH